MMHQPWVYERNNGLVEHVMGTSLVPPDESYLVLDMLDMKPAALWCGKPPNEPVPVIHRRIRFVLVSAPDAGQVHYREEGWIE
jgi:hypothetical protein